MDRPFLNGTIYSRELDGWIVSWESDGDYRHWCIQRQAGCDGRDLIAVVLINPGSLSKDGRELRRDTTLRILRSTFAQARSGCLVLNLFDLATPKPPELFKRWDLRDKTKSQLIYEVFPRDRIVAAMFAYGDYENLRDRRIATEIKQRIRFVRASLQGLPLIETPTNESGSPKHVMKWQIDRHTPDMKNRVRQFG